MKLIVATRGSALALWQSRWVIERLREYHGPNLAVELLTVRTRGDRVQNVPIAQIGGKGIFVKEVEDALLSKAAHLGVHSLKDLPAEQPPGLCLAAIPIREDSRDALVLARSGVHLFGPGTRGASDGVQSFGPDQSDQPDRTVAPIPERRNAGTPECLTALPLGAAVGTTSLRRSALLLHERPDLRIQLLRGNLDTRLRKLDAGEHDAAMLAAAGLLRLGFANRISQLLPVEQFVPCAGQGALAIEARTDETAVRELLAPLDHGPTRACVEAERTVLRRLGASCNTPLGVHARIEDGEMLLHAVLATPDGSEFIRLATHAPTVDPEAAGHRLADSLLDAGGDRILAILRSEVRENG
jgi:hydroxymethylbilane synthase